MSPTLIKAACILALLGKAIAWGSTGHETVAYIASQLVSSDTAQYCQNILGDTSSSYLANVATWADSYRYTSAGSFSAPYHFIDAQDNPPSSCGVDYDRDCGSKGCVVAAISNYTSNVLNNDPSSQAAYDGLRFVVHFLGDVHQPLHDENLDVGGNTISVTYAGSTNWNLHSVWDTAMIGTDAGSATLAHASTFANKLVGYINGKYSDETSTWTNGMDINDAQSSAMSWAQDANQYVCSVVMPNGVAPLQNEDLSGSYYQSAIPTVEYLLSKAGYRLAAWLNLMATGSTQGL